MANIISVEVIATKILEIRGKKVMLDKDLAIKLDVLERKYADHDEKIQKIFDAIRQLMAPPEEPKRRIGFHAQ